MNGLLLLRSPGPEDFKKKKGWSSLKKSQKSVTSSQESRTALSSTPVKEENEPQALEDLPKNEPSPDSDDLISYSPLSEFPAETENKISECRKSLFSHDASENETEDSMDLPSDKFSSEDEFLIDFIDNLESESVRGKDTPSVNTQLESVASLASANQATSSASTGGENSLSESNSAIKSSIQSPQSIVLERLRETILTSDNLPLTNLNCSSVQSVPSSQASLSMPPQRGLSKAGQVSGLKQTDIGVFFGLKPLKEKEKEAESGPAGLKNDSDPTAGRQRRERQRKNKSDTAPEALQSGDNGSAGDAQGESGKRKRGGWRKGWNRVNADGEVEKPHCPFYKKIPGK